jgi:hypothetical protein
MGVTWCFEFGVEVLIGSVFDIAGSLDIYSDVKEVARKLGVGMASLRVFAAYA